MIRRQIVNLAAKVTLKIILQGFGNGRHQRVKIKLHKTMSTQVRLLDVAAQHSSMVFCSTLQADFAQDLCHLRIGPEVLKSAVSHELGDAKSQFPWDGTMQQLLEDLVMELNRHERNLVKAIIHHSNLPQRQAHMILSQLMNLRVAHAPLA